MNWNKVGEVLLAVLDKLATMVVDRRLLFVLATEAAFLFGLPHVAEDAELLNDTVSEAILLAGQLITTLTLAVGLLASWTRRPPSGLNMRTSEKALVELLQKITKEDA